MPDDAKTPMKTPMTSFSKGGGNVPEPTAVAIGGDSLEQRVGDLEMRPRMPASGTGIDGEVLTLDGVSPRWGTGGAGSVPNGAAIGDVLFWDTGAAPDPAWAVLTNPAADGKVLQSKVAGDAIEFDFLKWR